MPRLSQTFKQKQKLAPRQVLQAKLLQLNTVNLEQTILKELEQNPVLEQIEAEEYDDKSMAEEILEEVDAPVEDMYTDESSYYLDQENIPQETPVPKIQISNLRRDFEWPNSYWFIAERTNGRLAMIGFMAVIINYTLFGWIAYPIL